MFFQKNNTCIIFGSSPFINELGKEKIELLQKNYTTFGINCFPIAYNNVDYWIWSDYGNCENFLPYIKNHKIITSLEVKRKELNNKIYPHYIFEGVAEIQHSLNNNLAIYKTTAHPAINYAYLIGFKNIILVGIDLSSNWEHFYNLDNTTRTNKRIERIRNKLYEFKQFINLYTLNPNSDLDIQKIKFEDLISK